MTRAMAIQMRRWASYRLQVAGELTKIKALSLPVSQHAGRATSGRKGAKRPNVTARLIQTSSLATLAVLAYAVPSIAQPDRYYYGPHMWGWGWFFGPVVMIGTFILIVVLAAIAVRWMGDQGAAGRPPQGKTAQDILAERFARGEIDKNEFEERRKLLGA